MWDVKDRMSREVVTVPVRDHPGPHFKKKVLTLLSLSSSLRLSRERLLSLSRSLSSLLESIIPISPEFHFASSDHHPPLTSSSTSSSSCSARWFPKLTSLSVSIPLCYHRFVYSHFSIVFHVVYVVMCCYEERKARWSKRGVHRK